jgi:succinate dehydrogenase / fumarate reductase flavoprotein subunit
MGGLWVDYTLQTTIPGLFAIGESNFSDHGANRLGASAMMQCLADGYFVLPHTVTDYLARLKEPFADPKHAAYGEAMSDVHARIGKLMSIDGHTPPRLLHRELGRLMIENCGITRSAAKLEKALGEIPNIREQFWSDLKIGGETNNLNQNLEYAGRVADFIDLSEVMCRDALLRDESCGCHLREEHQGPDGEPIRDDEDFANVAVWEYKGEGVDAERHIEPLQFDELKPKKRSYK